MKSYQTDWIQPFDALVAIDEFEPNDLKNNQLRISDRAFHDWYRFVLAFPPHLVRDHFDRFGIEKGATVLDPFCGTGTTVVEAKKNFIHSYGIEATPMAGFAARVKSNWPRKATALLDWANKILDKARRIETRSGSDFYDFDEEAKKIILKDSISPLPLHKCLILKQIIDGIDDAEIKELCLLALAFVSVHAASNLKFGPEVGLSRKRKQNANVFEEFYLKLSVMAKDLEMVENREHAKTKIVQSDSRGILDIPENTIDAIITSPPYPNEKDYTRTTRLESVLLGLIRNMSDLRGLKQGLLRSNTRNVYKIDSDDHLIEPGSRVDRIANEIERRRIALNKTSGFERLYHRVTRLYFGGMKRHFLSLQRALKSGAKLAYVVGDQASYLQVLIRTGELLGEIAEQAGYRVIDLDLFRTRLSTTTGEQLREEILILEWSNGIRMKKTKNRYDQLIERVFFANYKKGSVSVEFDRTEFETIARDLKIPLPKNLGDIVYSYRYRNKLPNKITRLLRKGEEWIIRSVGRGKYQFAKSVVHRISPNPRLTNIKILDSTPEIIRRYALNDEQALLAILRYNRLVDIFLGVACYPLQSHLRTTVPKMGQVETDEIYIGVGKKGAQYVVPIQAKGKSGELGIVQIEQDFAICETKFPSLSCRPIAAQFMEDDLIALFEFEKDDAEVTIAEEKHYRIVPNENLSDEEIKSYQED